MSQETIDEIKTDHVDTSSTTSSNEDFVECPVEDCGEVITLAELDDHVLLHGEETHSDSAGFPSSAQSPSGGKPRTASANAVRSSDSRRVRSRRHTKETKQSHAVQAWKRLFHVPTTAKESSSRHRSSSPPVVRKRLGVSCPCDVRFQN